MPIEHIIEIASWIIMIAILYIGIPKHTYREAWVSFLLMQALTWVSGGLVVEFKLIAYPVHFFSYAFRTNFTFEYFVFPAVSVLFNLHFPHNKVWSQKLLYSLAFPSVLMIGEIWAIKQTKLIAYINWSYFWSWATMLVSLYISYGYYRWFFSPRKAS